MAEIITLDLSPFWKSTDGTELALTRADAGAIIDHLATHLAATPTTLTATSSPPQNAHAASSEPLRAWEEEQHACRSCGMSLADYEPDETTCATCDDIPNPWGNFHDPTA